MDMALTLCLALSIASVAFGAEPQTKAAPQSKAKSETKARPPTKGETDPVKGFAVAPMVLTDEGCARDYVRAFEAEGVELRKRLADLETYGCVDTGARAIFVGLSIERKNFAIEKDNVAYFRYVIIKFDPERTKAAVGGPAVNPPAKTVYSGWIPDADFYAVSPEILVGRREENSHDDTVASAWEGKPETPAKPMHCPYHASPWKCARVQGSSLGRVWNLRNVMEGCSRLPKRHIECEAQHDEGHNRDGDCQSGHPLRVNGHFVVQLQHRLGL